MDWVIENKEWVFSGVGVTCITLVAGLLFKKKSSTINQQNIKSGDYSNNIQGNGNVTAEIGEKKDGE